jgi:hypothetical protein
MQWLIVPAVLATYAMAIGASYGALALGVGFTVLGIVIAGLGYALLGLITPAVARRFGVQPVAQYPRRIERRWRTQRGHRLLARPGERQRIPRTRARCAPIPQASRYQRVHLVCSRRRWGS